MGATFNIPTKNTETRRYVKRVKNAGKILKGSSVIDIDDFVTGCKDLGVWNSMVCWPLRSTQNTETNTALSLGGLGTYDGTLVNGPTWQNNGMYINGTQGVHLIPSFLNYPYAAGQYGVCSFAVSNPLEWQLEDADLVFFGSQPTSSWAYDAGNFHVTTGVGGGTTISLQMLNVDYNGRYANECSRLFGSPLITKNKYSYFGYTPSNTYQNCLFVVDNSSSINRENAVLSQTYGVLNSGITTNSILGCGGRSANTKGIISIVGYFSNNITASQHQQILNLYKTTLGKGLGLP
jgi:hypothetical protein